MTLLDTYIVLNAFLEIAIPILAAAVILEFLLFGLEEVLYQKKQKPSGGPDWNCTAPSSSVPEEASSASLWTSEPHRNERVVDKFTA